MQNHIHRKLAVFLPALHGGGAERTMLNLADGIATQGYSVDLVLAQATGPYLDQLPKSLRLVDLGNGRTATSHGTLKCFPALVRYLRREQPDAMLSALSRANLATVFAKRVAGVPKRVVLNEQNTLSKDAPQSPNRFVRVAHRVARYTYPWADRVVGVSQGVVDDLIEVIGLPEQQVQVIYNPGVTPRLREKAAASLDHPWFRPGEPPVILAVGRLDKQKDYPTLLAAFADLSQSHTARLMILGEGPARPQLEAIIKELDLESRVSMPGFVENPYAYMARAAVFVLSSLWEGLPTVLVEALYCGTSIVATDCPSGPREILRDGELGTLVPMSDPTALATAIQGALKGCTPTHSDQSWQPYALETIVQKYIDVLFPEV